MQKIKVLIVDDEALARQIIVNYLQDQEDILVAGECENGFDAMKCIADNKPDLVFLDIQMPKISGFELLEVISPLPEIIFTTAFDQYAIKAFEMNAIDYLLKPFAKDRFLLALDKARNRLKQARPEGETALSQLKQHLGQDNGPIDRIVVKQGNKIHVIPAAQIHYLEAQDDYVMIHCDQGKFLKEKTMRFFELCLPPRDFVRIHRSYLLNLSQALSVELYAKDTHLVVLKCGDRLKVSAEGYKKLREKLM